MELEKAHLANQLASQVSAPKSDWPIRRNPSPNSDLPAEILFRQVWTVPTGFSDSVGVLAAADVVLGHSDQPEDSDNVPD